MDPSTPRAKTSQGSLRPADWLRLLAPSCRPYDWSLAPNIFFFKLFLFSLILREQRVDPAKRLRIWN